jgi:hypothetical protein
MSHVSLGLWVRVYASSVLCVLTRFVVFGHSGQAPPSWDGAGDVWVTIRGGGLGGGMRHWKSAGFAREYEGL